MSTDIRHVRNSNLGLLEDINHRTGQRARKANAKRNRVLENLWGQITSNSAYKKRSELSKCMDSLGVGETLVIHEDKGHGRYMAEILVQVNALIERGVANKTLDERLKDRTSTHL